MTLRSYCWVDVWISQKSVILEPVDSVLADFTVGLRHNTLNIR